MKRQTLHWYVCWVLVLGAGAGMAGAETDFMEAAAPVGWVYQDFNIWQHGTGYSWEDTPLRDLDVDAYIHLFRVARWWESGVLHAILPVGYIDQTGYGADGSELVAGDTCGIGDIFVGGAYRWTSENKDWWLLGGADLRLPTGRYEEVNDPGCIHFSPAFTGLGGGVNMGSGSTSVQPFVIFTRMYQKGFIGHDTELRYDFNTGLGDIDYNPDDKVEIWQTLHVGLSKGLRVGATMKAEFEVEDEDGDADDNDHTGAEYIGVGPGAMLATEKGVVLWAKLLFDVYSKEYAEDIFTLYFRLSIPF